MSADMPSAAVALGQPSPPTPPDAAFETLVERLRSRGQLQGDEARAWTAADLARWLAGRYGLPELDLGSVRLDAESIAAVGLPLIERHRVLPLQRRDGVLQVAVADPGDVQALEALRFATGLIVAPVVVAVDALERALARVGETAGGGLDAVALTQGEDAPVVHFIDRVLRDAVRRRASDIHFEPYETQYRIRLRIDGQLVRIASPPAEMAARLAARLKVLAGLDLAERRLPQDGRFRYSPEAGRRLDFRVSTCPTLWGEKVVLRVLDGRDVPLEIAALGFEPAQQALYLSALHQSQGLILFTGPTGSGKTLSLYAGLDRLNGEGRNLASVEDPAEINLPGVNQVNVQPRIGLDFATVLRAFLRQDPDVIMVGEIRDAETAAIAIKAAQTGHLVLSTLHTRDAPRSLLRLLDMGVPAYNVAASVTLVIAQRLVRRLCRRCRRRVELTPDQLRREGVAEAAAEGGWQVHAAVGCNECQHGYRGRTGIYQVMPVSEAIAAQVTAGADAAAIAAEAAREGVIDLRQAAMNKLRAGIIDLAEANRVTRA